MDFLTLGAVPISIVSEFLSMFFYDFFPYSNVTCKLGTKVPGLVSYHFLTISFFKFCLLYLFMWTNCVLFLRMIKRYGTLKFKLFTSSLKITSTYDFARGHSQAV
jgi:hypothetical protein